MKTLRWVLAFRVLLLFVLQSFPFSWTACCQMASTADARGIWVHTGKLACPTYASAAVRLNDGSVLLAGRAGNNDFTNSEIYDVSSGQWLVTAPLNDRRCNHALTLLTNGNAFVVGGQNSKRGLLASAELFDSAARNWERAGEMSFARVRHTATLLLDGKVLVAGGYVGTNDLVQTVKYTENENGTTSVKRITQHSDTERPHGQTAVAYGDAGSEVFEELYNPASGSWQRTGAMNRPRGLHTATLLTNGQVLVAGGINLQDGLLASAELYNPITGKWTEVGSMPSARGRHTATLLPDGRVLVVGGQDAEGIPVLDAELFDPNTTRWTTVRGPLMARSFHTATPLGDGRVLIVGGHCLEGSTRIVEIYDVTTRRWTRARPLAEAREWHVAALLKDGRVLVAGGTQEDWQHPLSTAEIFDATPAPTN